VGAARSELRLVFRTCLAGVVEFLRLLFGIEVIEIAEPFIEPVLGRQEFIAVP